MNILDLQTRLRAAGFDPGPLDGKFGPATQGAVVRFQRSLGLVPDGIVGALTLAKLAPDLVPKAPEGLLTQDVIRKVFPKAQPALVEALLRADKFRAAGITTPKRMAHFLAQIGAETGGLVSLEENLNYSAQGLVKTFKKYFPTLADAAPFVGRPADIANKVYRKRLGNTLPGDGWTYRGSGLLMNTGRKNYALAGMENTPWLLREAGPALDSALAFWIHNGLVALSDYGTVSQLRKKVQGGSLGVADAKLYYSRATKALGIS